MESPEGDVVLKLDASGKPAVITDKYGSYALTTIDPTDESMVVDQASLDSSVAQSGWSEADVLSAQQFVVTFVAEQLNDSTALDRQTGWEQWKQDEAPKYVHPDYVDGIRSEQSDGADRSIIISNNFNNATPDLVRDGGPRVAAGEISTDQVWAFTTDAGVPALSIKGTSSYTYRAVDGAPVYSDTDWAYALARSEGSWLITGFENGFDLRR
ncbi:hypothetical protein C5D36_09815 [Rathayibacter sp. AY1C6]|nr:hypothetical protein C5D36_09815 [Rathayibacter sp. AY1C6]PPG28157.1 hypothetical protein C5C25_12730 [Rathayibacter sp. AY2B9]